MSPVSPVFPVAHSCCRRSIDTPEWLAYLLRAMATKYCPQCQTNVTQPLQLCPKCDAVLSLKDPYSLVGRTLLDRYQIEALVGLGGMGAVYCAFHQGIERRVAIKVLQPNIVLADERLVELFEREAKVAGRLTHENIVDIKDAGRIEEQGSTLAYIVMEWLDGLTLEDELRELHQAGGQLSFAQAHEITRQMASALAEAHSKNVVHRDLKPANVMLLNKPDGRIVVKVLDFGIGKIINQTSGQTGAAVSAVMGTPNYASPEQLQLGSKLDHRSDIYSMGVMLYRMIGGRLPFNSASLPELIQLQLNSTPAALRTLRPDVPVALEGLIHRMLAKEADDRPQSMAEVADGFAAALQSISTSETATLISGSIPAVTKNRSKTDQRKTDQRKTELMTEAPTPRRIEIATNDPLATNVMAASASVVTTQAPPRRSLLLPGVLLGAALAAGGGFGFYYFGTHPDIEPAQVNAPSPQATLVTMATSAPSASATITASVQPSAQPGATKAPTNKTDVTKSPTAAPAVSATPATIAQSSSALPLPGKSSLPSPPGQSDQRDQSNTMANGVTDNMPLKMYLNAQREYQNGNYQESLAICNRILNNFPRHRGALALRQKLLAGMKVLQDKP